MRECLPRRLASLPKLFPALFHSPALVVTDLRSLPGGPRSRFVGSDFRLQSPRLESLSSD